MLVVLMAIFLSDLVVFPVSSVYMMSMPCKLATKLIPCGCSMGMMALDNLIAFDQGRVPPNAL